jgi:O-antigen ligase
LIVAIAIAGALVLTSAVVGSALQRKQTVAAENVSSRFYFWQVALDEFRGQPFTGVGPGNYTVRFTDFAPPFSWKAGAQTTHNAYLNILAELGIAGMLAFVGFLVTSIRDVTQRPDDRVTRDLMSALATSFVIALVGSLFLTEQFYAPMWLWPALAAGVLRGSPAD